MLFQADGNDGKGHDGMAERLIPLDGAHTVEVSGNLTGKRVYRKRRDGTIRTSGRDARSLLREGLAIRASATGPIAHLPGYQCGACGRRNHFATCGKCGSADGRREGQNG